LPQHKKLLQRDQVAAILDVVDDRLMRIQADRRLALREVALTYPSSEQRSESLALVGECEVSPAYEFSHIWYALTASNRGPAG
jgi:hypothetical protein